MDNIEAALERYEKVLWQAVPPKWEDCLARIDLLRTLHREALSTIRQALRETAEQRDQFRQDFMEVSVQWSQAEDRIEKLEAALTLITQDIRFLAAAPIARQALSTPSEPQYEKQMPDHMTESDR